MVETVGQGADGPFHQAKVIHHLPVIQGMCLQDELDNIAVAVQRAAATVTAAISDNMGVFKTEQFAD